MVGVVDRQLAEEDEVVPAVPQRGGERLGDGPAVGRDAVHLQQDTAIRA